MRNSWLVVALLLACVTEARAEGINISWDDCGPAGPSVKKFACDENAGLPFVLIGSFYPPESVDEYLGFSAALDIDFDQDPAVPDWWHFGNGQCRGSALSVGFDFISGPYTCLDPFYGQATGGFQYEVGFSAAHHARLRIQAGVPLAAVGSLDPGWEYYAFRVRIQRSKATGSDSCSGCDRPGCIAFNEVQLFQPPERGYDPIITAPANNSLAGWQGYDCRPCTCPAERVSLGQVLCRFRDRF